MLTYMTIVFRLANNILDTAAYPGYKFIGDGVFLKVMFYLLRYKLHIINTFTISFNYSMVLLLKVISIVNFY